MADYQYGSRLLASHPGQSWPSHADSPTAFQPSAFSALGTDSMWDHLSMLAILEPEGVEWLTPESGDETLVAPLFARHPDDEMDDEAIEEEEEDADDEEDDDFDDDDFDDEEDDLDDDIDEDEDLDEIDDIDIDEEDDDLDDDDDIDDLDDDDEEDVEDI